MVIWYKYGDNSAPHSNEDKVGNSKGEKKKKIDILYKGKHPGETREGSCGPQSVMHRASVS